MNEKHATPADADALTQASARLEAIQALVHEYRVLETRMFEQHFESYAEEEANEILYGDRAHLVADECEYLLSEVARLQATVDAQQAALETVYIVETNGYDGGSTLGIYTRREQAEAELLRWVKDENEDNYRDFPGEPEFWWVEAVNHKGEPCFQRGHDRASVSTFPLNVKAEYSWDRDKAARQPDADDAGAG